MVSWCLLMFCFMFCLAMVQACFLITCFFPEFFSDQSLRAATVAGAHPDSPSKRAMVKRAADVDGQDYPSKTVRDCYCMDEYMSY